MANRDCNVYFPLIEGGRAATLATAATSLDRGLDFLGRALWRSSAHCAEQSALAALLGGALPDMGPDGEIKGWLNIGFRFDPETLIPKLLGTASPSTSMRLRAEGWQRGLDEGRVDEQLRARLAAIPLAERMERKSGIGDKSCHLLSTPLPTTGDIFGSRSPAHVPVLSGAGSAKLLAAMLVSHDPMHGSLDDCVDFAPRYLYADGRWLTPMFSLAAGKPIRLDGALREAAWVPVSQALALSPLANAFSELYEPHLRSGLTSEDQADLLAIGRAVKPKLFFQGSPEARAWFERAEMAIGAAHSFAPSRRSSTL